MVHFLGKRQRNTNAKSHVRAGPSGRHQCKMTMAMLQPLSRKTLLPPMRPSNTGRVGALRDRPTLSTGTRLPSLSPKHPSCNHTDTFLVAAGPVFCSCCSSVCSCCSSTQVHQCKYTFIAIGIKVNILFEGDDHIPHNLVMCSWLYTFTVISHGA